jgi:hypothetical protein
MEKSESDLRRQAELEKKARLWDEAEDKRFAAEYENSLTGNVSSDTGESTAPSS